MRLATLLLFIPTLLPLSGCITGCDVHLRQATWEQDSPRLSHLASTDYRYGDLWGGVAGDAANNKTLHLYVYANDTVSHDEMVEFANALFASKGWPPPQLEGAKEEAGCGDQY